MKNVLTVGIVVAVLAGGFAVYHYSGARGEVAKNKVLSQIDKWLGESEVRRTEIDRGIRGMEEGITKLSEARIKAQVQVDILGKEVKGNKAKTEDSKAALAKLKGDLSAFEADGTFTVSYGSTKYTKKGDLEKMAGRVIAAHKSLVTQTEALEARCKTYEVTAANLEKREEDAKGKLTQMKNSLKELDADLLMVNAQREAAAALNENDKSFATNVAALEKKVTELTVGVKTAVKLEDEKMKEFIVKNEVEDAAKEVMKSKNTINEIDELLGSK